ncbi:hypothetical protein ACLMJK_006025 [Lecanora helva]
MSGHDDFDETAAHRTTRAAYSPRHPVPTVQRFHDRQESRNQEASAQIPGHAEDTESRGLMQSAKNLIRRDSSPKDDTVDEHHPYQSENRNIEAHAESHEKTTNDHRKAESEDPDGRKQHSTQDAGLGDISETMNSTLDPRQKRKEMKHMKRDYASREVTDPVTHLRVVVHDSTSKELKAVPENEPPSNSLPRNSTGLSTSSKDQVDLDKEADEQQAQHKAMEKLFPPPNFAATREEMTTVYSFALTVGLGGILASTTVTVASGVLALSQTGTPRTSLTMLVFSSVLVFAVLLTGGGVIWGMQGWLKNKIKGIWDDELWAAARKQEQATSDSPMPESTQWLNSLLASVWSLINPDLFTSLADTLEDVMQASLPKLVRMISVEDLGQGNESIRILGVRWLPIGAAAQNISEDGKVKPGEKQQSDRKVIGEGELGDETKLNDDPGHQQDLAKDGDDQGEEQNVAEGMEAEEGDFVNVEIAFSYRASKTGKSIKTKSKNAHLYLAFYLPGGIRFPVWVELRGIVGSMRIRLQLCPDPPFFALCTLTLLGQPKADLSCVPLTKKGLNIMDLPLISSFVQSSIDAALAEYVAPKSLTLDLKDMLVGDDFKKDTNARGIIVVHVKRGHDFKAGDPGMGPFRKGSSDPYVAIGWAKFGKPVWSTRVIVDSMQPVWEETAFILMTAEELNAEERLRIQLWDSDRASADDNLGRIEVDLKELMHSPRSNRKMWDRSDGFLALEGEEEMPGILDWSVGYYPKTRIHEEQLKQQNVETDINTVQELKDKISEEASKKLREATVRDESKELDQQKAQMLKDTEDAMIISTPPIHEYPTGVFSIQIHNIIGLEYEKTNRTRADNAESEDDTAEGKGDLPSSYTTVILNHHTIFKTRTKPKNAKPFFNAGTERLIRDWRTAEIMVSVRDSRVHENDPLLGLVYLPLGKIFESRSQIMDSFPLVGGIAYGKVRISLVFRSMQIKLPRELLGWDSYGTIEITSAVTSKDLPHDLHGLRLKLRAGINRGKMYTAKSGDDSGSQWTGKHDRPVRLAVCKRYSSCLVVEFRKTNLGLDKTPAFAILWLKDIPDDEQRTVTLAVWRGDSEKLKRAETNCLTGEMGERAGTIEVPLRLHRGLGTYHQRLASHSPRLQDVFEVLSTANDNQELHTSIIDDDTSSSSDSDSSSDEQKNPKRAASSLKKKLSGNNDNPSDTDGADDDNNGAKHSGPIEGLKDYKKHSKQLHRRHRGLMQWKVARTGDYVKTKVEHGRDHVMDGFKHHDREPGIETEV